MASRVRHAALDQLRRIEEEGAFIGFFTREERDRLDARDRRQATDLIGGVTRWRRRLDFILASYYRGEYEGMEAPLRDILRLGLFELLYSETPPHAALNEAVELARERVRPGAAGLTNGILRAIQRAMPELPEPDTGDAADDLAIAHSHPTWMVRRWLERYGREEAVRLLEWNNTRPTFGVRINTLQSDIASVQTEMKEAGVEFAESAHLPDFVRVESVQPLIEGGFFERGLCVIQDESAGLVIRLLDPKPSTTLLDTCAAPGGKSFYAATRMENRGQVVALDQNEAKLRRLATGAERQGLGIIETHPADARRLRGHTQYDAVLVDAPCSGLGVLAKRADLRWRRTPEDLEELAELQDDLLDAAAQSVRAGGVLVYSTCTIEPEENEERVARFMERNPSFIEYPQRDEVLDPFRAGRAQIATLPQRDEMDGAFAVRLRRTS